MPLPAPVMPDADALVAAFLARGLGDDTVTVESVPTGDVYARCPFVQVRSTPSGGITHPYLGAAPVIDVECWNAPTKPDAVALAEACRVVLSAAPAVQHAPELGTIARAVVTSYPAERRLSGQPGGVFYVPATYQVWMRPPL